MLPGWAQSEAHTQASELVSGLAVHKEGQGAALQPAGYPCSTAPAPRCDSIVRCTQRLELFGVSVELWPVFVFL